MDKIRRPGSGTFRKYRPPDTRKDSSPIDAQDRISFNELWEAKSKAASDTSAAAFIDDFDGSLEDLVDEVHSQGEKLKEKPSYEHIRDYKGAVKNFLAYVIRHTLEVETKEGSRFNPLKKQRRYTLIKTIDEKLERLAAEIMQSQGAQIDILSRVEEINGLVVDLLS
jgi:uncharacterized protein